MGAYVLAILRRFNLKSALNENKLIFAFCSQTFLWVYVLVCVTLYTKLQVNLHTNAAKIGNPTWIHNHTFLFSLTFWRYKNKGSVTLDHSAHDSVVMDMLVTETMAIYIGSLNVGENCITIAKACKQLIVFQYIRPLQIIYMQCVFSNIRFQN